MAITFYMPLTAEDIDGNHWIVNEAGEKLEGPFPTRDAVKAQLKENLGRELNVDN